MFECFGLARALARAPALALLLLGSAAPAEDKEPKAILQFGAGAEWGLNGGSSGFGPTAAVEFTPIKNWLLDQRANALYAKLLDPSGFVASYLDMGRVKSLIDQHRAGVVDATDRVWRLLNLQHWGEIFMSGSGVRLDRKAEVREPVR